MWKSWRIGAAIFVLAISALAQQKPASEPYRWKSVQIVGGGFVDGLVFHPSALGVLYARTDMGGAYRRDPQTGRWLPLLDWVSYKDMNLMGVEAIALDPQDPNKVYMACGTYTEPGSPTGAILRSSDRGKSFARADAPIKFGGNENGRGNGERLAVDPNDGRVLYLGTRLSGLWRSTDGAATWSKVESFPAEAYKLTDEDVRGEHWRVGGRESIVFVAFDPASGKKGEPSRTIYVGVSNLGKPNLYRSNDGGATWSPVKGSPENLRPNHGLFVAGKLYLTYATDPGPMTSLSDGGVFVYDPKQEAWSDITPDKPTAERRFGYVGIAVDVNNPKSILVSSFYRPWTMGKNGAGAGDDLFHSNDGGKTWRAVFGSGGQFDYAKAPYVKDTGIHWMFGVAIDPSDPNHAMFTTGYGGWETRDLLKVDADAPTHWSVYAEGIEETVPLSLYSPTKGAPLITGVGDYSGFVHWDLDKVAPGGNPKPPFFGNTNDVAGGDLNPDLVARVGHDRDNSGHPISYSLDGGRTWKLTARTPGQKAQLGRLAISADGSVWVWTPDSFNWGEKMHPARTADKGDSWTPLTSLDKGLRLTADRVNPKLFYGLKLFEGKIMTSDDGAQSFVERAFTLSDGLPKPGGDRGDDRGGQDQLYAAPGREGDLWIAAYNGLYHAPRFAASADFARQPSVEQILAFGFGKAKPGGDYPSLYLVGVVDGVYGVFRSTDEARTWTRINDEAHQWGKILLVTGDPKQYGRVYVGTHGRGAWYGDPEK